METKETSKEFTLICISPDGEEVIENTFNSIKDAWERNNDMGSRWYFYPYRVIIDNEGIISSTILELEIYEGLNWKNKKKEYIKTCNIIYNGL